MSRLTFSEAKKIPIIDYLSSLGFEPAKIRGVDYWYHSPGRADKEPSFKVDTKQNVWYDHGEGRGGTIIELGMQLHHCTPVEFLHKLAEGNYQSDRFNISKVSSPEKKDNEVIIQFVRPLENEHLLFYANQRGIDNPLAKKNCSEVEFSIRGKAYRAIGFANRSGGWELRNAWFKGSSSPKDVSLIQHRHAIKLTICEGFMDYLSLLKMDNPPIQSVIEDSDFLILNSLSFLHKNYELFQRYPDLNLFLDNDSAGHKAKAKLDANNIVYKDHSNLYTRHKDVNDLLIFRIKESLKAYPNKHIKFSL